MRALLVAAVVAGCAGPEVGDEPVVWLDYDQFVASVQPVLGDRCGNPSCHGRADRPLAIYSPGRYRADADRTHLPEPLTGDELAANFQKACLFAASDGAPADAPLVAAPLADRVAHGGGAIFAGPTDAGYRALLAWVHRGGQP